MPEEQKKPKIIIDEDWKAQAQAEKEKLAEQVESKPAPGAPPAAGAAAGRRAEGARELPPADFTGLVNMLAAQALYALGGMEDPQTRRRYVDLALGKHYIDLLSVLEEKTKGNLADEEKKFLDQALYETRLHYVEIAQRLSAI